MATARRPLLAGLLSLLVVGLGDAYNGFPRRGVWLLVIALGSMLALAFSWSFLFALQPNPSFGGLLVLWFAFPAAVKLYGTIRAWRDARRLRDTPAPPRRVRACVVYFICAYAATALVAGGIRLLVVQAFNIPSGAMIPTLLIGDHIIVDNLEYGPRLGSTSRGPGIHRPEPGDVVVFMWPKDRTKDFVKRVVAVEGETVEIRDRRVLVDGAVRDDPHARWSNTRSESARWGPFTVPPGHVFVMGDNRDQSYDSRFWGPLPISDIKGKVSIIYWSWDSDRSRVRWERISQRVY